jgi:hypothetical protein
MCWWLTAIQAQDCATFQAQPTVAELIVLAVRPVTCCDSLATAEPINYCLVSIPCKKTVSNELVAGIIPP